MPTTSDVFEPLLTTDEERDLATQIEAGVLAAEALARGQRPFGASERELRTLAEQGQAARARFAEANLGLVRTVSHQIGARSGVNEADLFQEGCLGLLTAIIRFDCQRGIRFATYAMFWIRAFAGAAAASMLGELNVPASRAVQLRALRGLEGALSQTLGRAATAADVGEAVGRSEAWVAKLLAHVPAESLSDVSADLINVPSTTEAGFGPDELCELMRHLDDLGQRVLELRHGFVTGSPLSYADVACRLRLSVSRIRRVERAALEELRGLCPYDAVAS